MMSMLTPYLAEETAYRREQLTRAWGHRRTGHTPRPGRGSGPRGRAAVAAAPTSGRTALPAR